MCEMLGMSAKRKRRANGLLREFYSHAEAHPHGWGLARFPAGVAPAEGVEGIEEPLQRGEKELAPRERSGIERARPRQAEIDVRHAQGSASCGQPDRETARPVR